MMVKSGDTELIAIVDFGCVGLYPPFTGYYSGELDYKVPYGILYSKQLSDEVKRFIEIIKNSI